MQCPDLQGMSQDLRANLNQAYMGKQSTPEEVFQRWRQELDANGASGSSSHPAEQAHQCTLCHASGHRCMLPKALPDLWSSSAAFLTCHLVLCTPTQGGMKEVPTGISSDDF